MSNRIPYPISNTYSEIGEANRKQTSYNGTFSLPSGATPSETDTLINGDRISDFKRWTPYRIAIYAMSILAIITVLSAISYFVYVEVNDEQDAHGLTPTESPDTPSPMRLHLFDGTDGNAEDARCLDGSRAGFYYRSGSDNNYIIYLQGGGICDSPEDCLTRSFTPLGSSSQWSPLYMPDTILDNRRVDNPFANSTHVLIPYCGGDAHSGTQKTKNDYGLYHAGYYNVNATITWLISNTNISQGDHVLITGDSAGGIGAFINADTIAHDLTGGPVVKAAPLGGYYFARNLSDLTQWESGVDDGNFDTTIANSMSQLYNAWLHKDCVTKHHGDVGECASVGVMHQYIKTPLFIAENMFDDDKTGRIGLPGARPNESAAFEAYYGGKVVEAVLDGIQNSADPTVHGYWLPSCTYHTENLGIQVHLTMKDQYGREISYTTALRDWLFDITAPAQIIDPCYRPGNGPCNPSCFGGGDN